MRPSVAFIGLLAVVGTLALAWSASVDVNAGRASRIEVTRALARDVGLALLTGSIIGLALFIAEENREESRFREAIEIERIRAEDSTRLSNLAFIRETLGNPNAVRVFDGLDLRGLPLQGLDLSGVDRYVSFEGADLTGADLRRSTLVGVWLLNATVAEADFSGAEAQRIALAGSDATYADFGWADVSFANFQGSDLTGAFFREADLSNADLSDAILRNAVLAGANLRNANLSGAELTGVCWDDETSWPVDFDPQRTGRPSETPGLCPTPVR